MTQDKANSVVPQAKALLGILMCASDQDVARAADDLLLFCHRLLEGYVIVRSTSPRIKGRTFGFLHDVIQGLESRPDDALRSTEWRDFLQFLLEDIVSGRISLAKKT